MLPACFVAEPFCYPIPELPAPPITLPDPLVMDFVVLENDCSPFFTPEPLDVDPLPTFFFTGVLSPPLELPIPAAPPTPMVPVVVIND